MSKATVESEQGKILGVTESVASISTVPGPLIGGILFEFGGLAAPFLVSSLILLFSVILGFSILRKNIQYN
jgi:MFS family permease